MNRHTALSYFCLFAIVNFDSMVDAKPSGTDQLNSLMLQLHNKVRKQVRDCQLAGQPQAKTIPDLKYDQELAEKAQNWANKCQVGHDKPEDRVTSTYKSVGQNFAGSRDFEQGFNLWFNEHVNYTFDDNKCKGPQCGHYTQVVWANTKAIGCAFKDCSNIGTFPYGNSIVCNYGPSGNYQGQKPYEKGDHEKCPPGSSSTTHYTNWIMCATVTGWISAFFSYM